MLDLVRELIGVGHSNAAGATWEVVVSNTGGTLGPQFNADVREEMVAMLLSNAPETLARLRTGHQVLARTEQGSLRKTELSKMHRQIRWLAGSAGPLGFRKIADMANALEALLIQLNARPAQITPSVIRTIAQAIDTLAYLFDRAVDPEGEGLAPPRILVVDDEIISRETVCSALSQAGLRPISLDDSLAARRLLEQEPFDLIFLDVEMPGESGLDLCVDIREMQTNHVTPVVFVTSHSDFASRAQSTLSGGNDFIAKPFLLVELAVKALTWLFKKDSEAPSVATARDSAPAKAGGNPSQATPGPVAQHDIVTATFGGVSAEPTWPHHRSRFTRAPNV
jgi:CheY-like chemotaxis protein